MTARAPMSTMVRMPRARAEEAIQAAIIAYLIAVLPGCIPHANVTAAGKPRLGTGYVVRTLHEDVLVGAVGSPSYAHALPSLFDGVAREHSRKPVEFFSLVEAFAPRARRVELFARESRPGWASWGLERTRFDALVGGTVAA